MGGFRKLDEVDIHRGRRFRVVRGRFSAPDGSELEREIVRHPGAVGVLPLHDDDTVTLLRQYRAALDDHLVEVPAGLRDVAGEPDIETAHRELVEEAGLAASQLVHLVDFHNSPGFSDETVAVFLATGLREVADDRQGLEEQAMEVLRVPFDEALAMVDDGRITDAKTIIALLVVAQRRA